MDLDYINGLLTTYDSWEDRLSNTANILSNLQCSYGCFSLVYLLLHETIAPPKKKIDK